MKLQLIFFYLLLAASFMLFTWRGIGRMTESRDSLGPYLSAVTLMRGNNPYDKRQLDETRQQLADQSPNELLPSYTLAIYPPCTIFLFSIFSRLSWQGFRKALILIDAVSLLVVLFIFSDVTALGKNNWRSLTIWIVGLNWAPWHSGMSTGNLIIPVMGVGVLGWWLAERKRWLAASFFLTVALVLKPQVGCLFVLVCCLRRHWRTMLVSFLNGVTITLVGLVWMELKGIRWWQAWQSNVSIFVTPGGENDPTSANPLRHDLLNVQRLLYTILSNSLWVNRVVICISVAVSLFLLWKHRDAERLPTPLLTASAVVVFGLLSVYHRFYDASLLLFVLAWSLSAWHSVLANIAKPTFLISLIFLIPGAAGLAASVREKRVPVFILGSWWWEPIVMCHQVWALLGIASLLTYALYRSELATGKLISG